MKKLDITGILSIGNGEWCPFCAADEQRQGYHDGPFMMEEGKDFIKHCAECHQSELNKALFGAKPKVKYWLEAPFVQLIAHVAAKLRFIDKPERIADEDYESTMEQIYHLISEYYNEVITHEGD